MKFAIFGTGFWARYQLAGWGEIEGAECAALYNRTRSKAERLAAEFGVPAVYDDPEELLATEKVDFIDIITDVDTHARFVRLAAGAGVPVICQKPMAPALREARDMVAACAQAGVPFLVHENWRWQTPVREMKWRLDDGAIGKPFRARIDFYTGFPVFDNQPFLREAKQFIILDIGSHILDVARYLFGEAASLYCTTSRIHTDINGEDVATITLLMESGATVVCNMAYAGNPREHDRFPETYIHVEGSGGTLELAPDYWIRETTAKGTWSRRCPPPRYAWADPRYEVVQASIVECNRNLYAALSGQGRAETTGEDNLKTAKLAFSSYESAAGNRVIDLKAF